MPRAEGAIEIDPLTHRKDTRRGEDPIAADDDAAVVQRSLRKKKG